MNNNCHAVRIRMRKRLKAHVRTLRAASLFLWGFFFFLFFFYFAVKNDAPRCKFCRFEAKFMIIRESAVIIAYDVHLHAVLRDTCTYSRITSSNCFCRNARDEN